MQIYKLTNQIINLMSKPNLIVDKTFHFSLMAIELCNVLDERKKFAISNQLLRSATSIGANVREAQNAESEQDFVHKLKIAAKEAEETMYWLDLCLYSPTYPNTEKERLELLSIIRIINKIIGTIKTKQISNLPMTQ